MPTISNFDREINWKQIISNFFRTGAKNNGTILPSADHIILDHINILNNTVRHFLYILQLSMLHSSYPSTAILQRFVTFLWTGKPHSPGKKTVQLRIIVMYVSS